MSGDAFDTHNTTRPWLTHQHTRMLLACTHTCCSASTTHTNAQWCLCSTIPHVTHVLPTSSGSRSHTQKKKSTSHDAGRPSRTPPTHVAVSGPSMQPNPSVRASLCAVKPHSALRLPQDHRHGKCTPRTSVRVTAETLHVCLIIKSPTHPPPPSLAYDGGHFQHALQTHRSSPNTPKCLDTPATHNALNNTNTNPATPPTPWPQPPPAAPPS